MLTTFRNNLAWRLLHCATALASGRFRQQLVEALVPVAVDFITDRTRRHWRTA